MLDIGAMVMIGKHQLCVVNAPPSPRRKPRVAAVTHVPEDVLLLECFAPDGSPLQGQVFTIGPGGASLGRRHSHIISFSREVGGELVGLDSSVSSDHARIQYDAIGRRFLIHDGNAQGRPSTNGTWIRLSGLHAPSHPVPIGSCDELLIGTIRFHASVTHTMVERDTDEDSNDHG